MTLWLAMTHTGAALDFIWASSASSSVQCLAGLICNFVVDIVLEEAHLEPEVLRPSWQGSPKKEIG